MAESVPSTEQGSSGDPQFRKFYVVAVICWILALVCIVVVPLLPKVTGIWCQLLYTIGALFFGAGMVSMILGILVTPIGPVREVKDEAETGRSAHRHSVS